jgi:hypothetical protein
MILNQSFAGITIYKFCDSRLEVEIIVVKTINSTVKLEGYVVINGFTIQNSKIKLL